MSIHFWCTLLADSYTTWVLFRHGTCVVGEVEGTRADDPAARAAAFLARYGPVQAGTDAGDFDVVAAPGGRLVTFYRPEMLGYVSHADVPPEQDDLLAGVVGRARRDADAKAPRVAHAHAARAAPPCACLDAPGRHLSPQRELGMDSHYAEATVLACRVCGRRWLRYQYENAAISRSGRWYLGHIPTAAALGLTAPAAKRALEQAPYYFAGGSYYGGEIGRMAGAIHL